MPEHGRLHGHLTNAAAQIPVLRKAPRLELFQGESDQLYQNVEDINLLSSIRTLSLIHVHYSE